MLIILLAISSENSDYNSVSVRVSRHELLTTISTKEKSRKTFSSSERS